MKTKTPGKQKSQKQKESRSKERKQLRTEVCERIIIHIARKGRTDMKRGMQMLGIRMRETRGALTNVGGKKGWPG